MSPSTAAPGRWQLPGGSVKPPQDGEALDEAALGGQAARELVEEMRIDTPPGTLRLWAATRGQNSSVGLTYLAPALPESVLPRASPARRERSAPRAVNPNSTTSHCRAPRRSWPAWPVRTRTTWIRSSANTRKRRFGKAPDSVTGEEVAHVFVEFGAQRRPRARKRARPPLMRLTALRVRTERTPSMCSPGARWRMPARCHRATADASSSTGQPPARQLWQLARFHLTRAGRSRPRSGLLGTDRRRGRAA
ncbi:hypothetical protein [Streptomyces sp. ISID311]|uniref:NUDIX hydrolase n=1 Tax=Streptomyces sp. ISID311 TaxID=2601673 RepID=UPI0021C3284F|nr:hypothetical protein [Streptomyces sp. ISID311]